MHMGHHCFERAVRAAPPGEYVALVAGLFAAQATIATVAAQAASIATVAAEATAANGVAAGTQFQPGRVGDKGVTAAMVTLLHGAADWPAAAGALGGSFHPGVMALLVANRF